MTTADVGGAASPGRQWLAAALCVAAVALIVSPNLIGVLRPYDSGIASSAATFTLHGLLPYRDYWLLYGPLSGWLVALPTALMGPSVGLLRVAGMAVLCAQAAAAFSIARSLASTRPAVAIAFASIAMYAALLGIEPSAWSVAMAFALTAVGLAIRADRGSMAIGALAGLTFLARLDMGIYVLLSALLVRERRATLAGFALIAGPFVIAALLTTGLGSLVEQLIWYPLVGPRQFRALPGPEAIVGQPTAAILSVPLLLIPRLAIVLAAARLALARVRDKPIAHLSGVLGLPVFATLCQLQTLGRADLEHYAQAATPAILLLAIWYREARPSLGRFAGLATVVAMCVAVGLLSSRYLGSANQSAEERAILASSTWIRQATARDEPIFVGLSSHRYTVMNPLLVYYLSDRRAGVRDAMFNPGVTNTDWGQTRMVSDLDASRTTYLVLDRSTADLHEEFNDSRFPGSTRLDTYIATHFHVLCDLEPLLIMVRNGADEGDSPACPALAP